MALRDTLFDLLVIGGGINGAAIARDASLRGLKVCLVEAKDWGWGTSAKSSKLAHGGLRYLELFEFGLVHEALQDRERLLRQAPHLVRPLRFVYPIYPHIAARRTVHVGLTLYDLLAHGKTLPRHHSIGRAETLELVPGLLHEGLSGGATFHDGQIRQVERLVLEMVLEARAQGATCLSRTRVDHLLWEDEGSQRRITGAQVESETGELSRIRARAVVNATGCWVDEVLGPLGEGKPPKVRKTKGIHVVVPRFTEVAVMVRARDGRSFFVLPWMESCVIGTTDTDYEGDAGDAVATAEDVEYLLSEARRYFPTAPLDKVRYTYAGVRALVNEAGMTESNVTRRHILYDHGKRDGVAGLWSLQGGKITTARSLAEAAVNKVARSLGKRDTAKLHPTRDRLYLGGHLGWDDYRSTAIAEAVGRGLDIRSATHLVESYGARWSEVLASDLDAAALGRIHPNHPEIFAEASHAMASEDARHLADFMLRRTTLGLVADGNPAAARAALDWMAQRGSWDDARVAAEWSDYLAELQHLAVPGQRPKQPVVA